MRYVFQEKEVYGRTYQEVVESMAGSKLHEPKSRAAYRKSVARRVKDLFNRELDTGDDKVFVLSLQRAGLLKRVDG